VPCIARAPGRIQPGKVCTDLATTLDFLPTLATLAGAKVPSDRVIDGHDITPLLHGTPGATSPTKEFYYYQRHRLQAVRAGQWKLHVPRPEDHMWAIYLTPADSAEIKAPLLFDLQNDIGERNNVAARHPEIVTRLLALAEKARADLGDHNRIGHGARYFDPEPKRSDIAAARP
jgi:arylsulfatase A-like enzyme